ncbi:M23 family metallopeptidase [Paenibacillus sp. J2TS4]|uniref:M23 family metallopeptidase n=1 Tax=Paenibacillus sp. J2TS4 TaxID=2807194 RepID=UPI001B0E0F48|nr:M23 family metallopeptidase [Paenibacillus sp. J2TS4]GIP35277.1 M23 family metallopeptidase [Paenibacillus sp. J2TS4]
MTNRLWKTAAAGLLSGCASEAPSAIQPSSPDTNQPSASPGNKAEEKDGQVAPDLFAKVFLQGDYERIYKQFSEEFKQQVSNTEFQALAADFNQGVAAYKLQSEVPLDNNVRYTWASEDGSKGMTAFFDPPGTILGLQVVLLEAFPETDGQYTSGKYQYPFAGEWFTFWGGTNVLVNYHYAHPSQRYAFDWIMLKEDRSYEGDPTKNESYYAFGQEVLAPADGKIVKVENDLDDNTPVGKMDPSNPAGNHVVIEHANGEYSMLAHFQKQSIQVKVGDEVKAGDLLGLCGNSGNSSEPHIHYHVSDSPDLDQGNSVRIQFIDGGDVKQGDYVRGS